MTVPPGDAAPERQERGPVSFPPPLVYIAGLAAGALLEARFPTPGLPRPLAVLVGLLAVAVFLSLDYRAMVVFRKNETGIAPWHPATALVTEGPYRRTRNPMYLGMAALYAGIALGFGLLWALALLPVVIVVIDRVVVRREEAYLEDKYGDAYRDYRNRVRRWI
jgi:protein-S-isoprenylcysteine O-methyltransferase Ste14